MHVAERTCGIAAAAPRAYAPTREPIETKVYRLISDEKYKE